MRIAFLVSVLSENCELGLLALVWRGVSVLLVLMSVVD